MRVVIAGILGGIAMFIWASVAHMATPLASAGLKPLPGGDATVASLHQTLGDKPGTYFFPYAAGQDSKAMAQQSAKMAAGPTGLMAYQGPGANAFPRQLVVEFALEVFESILVAILIVGVAGFGDRLRLVLAIGLIAAVTTNFSYWNWYGFDPTYTVANGFTELVKYLVSGLAAAWWLGRRERQARAFTDMRFGRA
jgi:hypothetical protein